MAKEPDPEILRQLKDNALDTDWDVSEIDWGIQFLPTGKIWVWVPAIRSAFVYPMMDLRLDRQSWERDYEARMVAQEASQNRSVA